MAGRGEVSGKKQVTRLKLETQPQIPLWTRSAQSSVQKTRAMEDSDGLQHCSTRAT